MPAALRGSTWAGRGEEEEQSDRLPGADSTKGSAFVAGVIKEAMLELLNPAQTNVPRQVKETLCPDAEAAPV